MGLLDSLWVISFGLSISHMVRIFSLMSTFNGVQTCGPAPPHPTGGAAPPDLEAQFGVARATTKLVARADLQPAVLVSGATVSIANVSLLFLHAFFFTSSFFFWVQLSLLPQKQRDGAAGPRTVDGAGGLGRAERQPRVVRQLADDPRQGLGVVRALERAWAVFFKTLLPRTTKKESCIL